MNRLIFAITPLLFMLACKPSSNYLIEGAIADSKSENEWVYLIPFEGISTGKIDSARVESGHFSITGTVESPEMCILKTNPFLRLNAQEILVVREPGHVEVLLSSNSSARGTALNDSLQYWRDSKLDMEKQRREVMFQFREGNDEVKEMSVKQLDSLKIVFRDFNLNFVENNRENVVGKSVYKMTRGFFSNEQKDSLGLE